MTENARHRFDIHPLDRFAGTHSAIKRPTVRLHFVLDHKFATSKLTSWQEIAYFSYDEDHQYRPDDSSLQYYYPPRLGANLSDGFERFRKLDESRDDHLDGLLKTITKLEKTEGHSRRVDIVTWRGIMTKVFKSCPCLQRFVAGANPWKILVAPFEKFNRYEFMAVTALRSEPRLRNGSFNLNATFYQVCSAHAIHKTFR